MIKYCITLIGGLLLTQVALASPTEVNLSIKRQPSENYDRFVQRAETLATQTVQQRFAENQSLDELRVLVVGENQGAIAPLLTVQVNRLDWRGEPNVKRWQTVFPYSQDLLGFNQQQAQIDKPTVPTSPISTPEPVMSPSPIPTPDTTATPPKQPPTLDPSEMFPLPYPDQIPSLEPQPPIPNQRLQPNRIKQE
jgi:hypothetical protein